jgi:hypothetical protein
VQTPRWRRLVLWQRRDKDAGYFLGGLPDGGAVGAPDAGFFVLPPAGEDWVPLAMGFSFLNQ